MQCYPMFLDLRGRHALVVGAGEVRTRKTEGLIAAGAIVTIISPRTNKKVTRWREKEKSLICSGRIARVTSRDILLRLLPPALLKSNILMACDANHESVLLNVVDRPVLCIFILPAVLQRGDLAIAVSTGGKCPGFAKCLRQKLERTITPEYSIVLDAVAAARHEVLSDFITIGDRQAPEHR